MGLDTPSSLFNIFYCQLRVVRDTSYDQNW